MKSKEKWAKFSNIFRVLGVFLLVLALCHVSMAAADSVGAAPHHNISVVFGVGGSQWIECEGENVTSLLILPCDSLELCRAAQSCLLNNSNHDNKTDCAYYDADKEEGSSCNLQQDEEDHEIEQDDQSQDEELLVNSTAVKSISDSSSCFRIKIPDGVNSGLVQCKSGKNVQLPGKNETVEKGQVSTFDYFYTAHNLQKLLGSKSRDSPDNIQLRVYHHHAQGMVPPASASVKSALYTNQQVMVQCLVPQFLFNLEELQIRVVKNDDSILNLDPKMVDKENFLGLHWEASIYKFRVFKEIRGFSCRVPKRSNSSEWIQQSLNFTVIDPPTAFTARSKSGDLFPVTKAMRCGLTGGPADAILHMEKYLSLLQLLEFKISESPVEQDLRIKDAIQYLGFQEIVGDRYYCHNWDDRNYLTSKLGFMPQLFPELPVEFELKPPAIEKLQGQVVIVDPGKSNKTTLSCKIDGSPAPYVIWLRNGLEMFYSVAPDDSEGVVTLELDVNIIPLSGGEKGNKTTPAKTDSYSCLAHNHLGKDRLDFVVPTN